MQPNTSRQEHTRNLYLEVFPAVARYISKTGGSFEDARDVFQDSLLVYIEKKQNGFVPEINEKVYLLGMARNQWLKRLERHEKRFVHHVPDLNEEENNEVSISRLMRFLEHSGKKCMELLQTVYYEKLPMKTIAERFGFSGERSATVQKHKCLEKVRDSIKEKSLVYEDFCD